MNLDRLNQKLDRTLATRSVCELADFPYQDFAEFVAAYESNQIEIRTRFHPWTVLRVLNSWNEIGTALVMLNGYALSIGSLAYVTLTHQWWALVGIPLGAICVHSANARLGLLDLFFAIPFLILAFVVMAFDPGGSHCLFVLTAVGTVSKVFAHVAVGMKVMEIEQKLCDSELLLIWLYSEHLIVIFNKSTGEYHQSKLLAD